MSNATPLIQNIVTRANAARVVLGDSPSADTLTIASRLYQQASEEAALLADQMRVRAAAALLEAATRREGDDDASPRS